MTTHSSPAFTPWSGGAQPPETRGRQVEVRFRAGDVPNAVGPADDGRWGHPPGYSAGCPSDIVSYRVVGDTPTARAPEVADTREYTGGSVSYYSVAVKQPTSGGAAYSAECNDLIEALRLNYAEGNVLKALWRIAAMRVGKSKKGYTDGVYDAEKIVFFGQRVLAQQQAERDK